MGIYSLWSYRSIGRHSLWVAHSIGIKIQIPVWSVAHSCDDDVDGGGGADDGRGTYLILVSHTLTHTHIQTHRQTDRRSSEHQFPGGFFGDGNFSISNCWRVHKTFTRKQIDAVREREREFAQLSAKTIYAFIENLHNNPKRSAMSFCSFNYYCCLNNFLLYCLLVGKR